MQMDQIFRPLTSSPFRRDDTYTEILPCEALRPYICCFWGTSQPLQTCDAACESLVTPETSCQGLFNQIHKKSTKRVPEALSGSGTQG